MKTKLNVIENENGTTALVTFAAANVSDTCLGLGLFLKPLQIKILLMNVSHNSSF
jgi:hypothetical protein